MKRVYVEEQWCLGCHLCEYNCAFANSGLDNMAKALKDKEIRPRIHIEDGEDIHFAVSCRHCQDAICMKSCIAGAISKKDGVVCIDCGCGQNSPLSRLAALCLDDMSVYYV